MGGRAVGPVKNGICQACNMNIPPQRFNELIKGNSLLFCPNCRRIIYWAEDEYYKENRY
jgi:predicted  nucleic acid-binding Zn-ribbon protein